MTNEQDMFQLQNFTHFLCPLSLHVTGALRIVVAYFR